MEIKTKKQFNQGTDQYKLLSTASGVGALVATKVGTFIMPLTIDKWHFIQRVQNHLQRNSSDPDSRIVSDEAVTLIEDNRFIKYLATNEGLSGLKQLVAIPHLQLDKFNCLKVKDNPLYKKYLSSTMTPNQADNYFNVPAMVFPRWMFNPRTHVLAPYSEWIMKWKKTGHQTYEFAPPKESNVDGLGDTKIDRLKQMHLVLICDNGHISDIPWDKFFAAYKIHMQSVYRAGFDLFHQNPCNCIDNSSHSLTYMENEDHSDGWGWLECTKCHTKVPLDGIMNLKPLCSKEMPWLGQSSPNTDKFKIDTNNCNDGNHPSTMRVALVTSHSVYYAETASSIFIPQLTSTSASSEASTLTPAVQGCLNWINNAYNATPTQDKKDFAKSLGGYDTLKGLAKNDLTFTDDEFKKAYDAFLTIPAAISDKEESYRYDEYKEFTRDMPINDSRLYITDVLLESKIASYFKCIRQVHTLCITRTQLGFFRGKFKAPTLNSRGGVDYPVSMSLSGQNKNDILAYPALQEYGEGLFFELNEALLKEWSNNIGQIVGSRYSARDYESHAALSLILDKYNMADRFYLIHTFAHAIIKELEFSCGYPSDSLSERIYFSDRMCGVLIYTADGSEGSMGGLVWQGQSNLIENIIIKAMRRANECSSDPICWHHEESLNYAACFSCSMISETSCEYGNSGLDRRALIDPKFGYFRDLVK